MRRRVPGSVAAVAMIHTMRTPERQEVFGVNEFKKQQ
jgi:hypothetical protein